MQPETRKCLYDVFKACEAILQFVKDRSFEGCWECPDYERCENLEFLKPFHGDTPLRNLGKIKELGIGAWAAQRGKFYPWQE